jgi:hypothetical protein
MRAGATALELNQRGSDGGGERVCANRQPADETGVESYVLVHQKTNEPVNQLGCSLEPCDPG